MTLTKARVVEQIHSKIGLPQKESSEAFEKLLEIIKSTLESGEDILISGFGKFCVNEKNARKGRNPATGADMMIKPRRVVTFKCSAGLRDRINRKK
jgi:integration host factor subunit alpha